MSKKRVWSSPVRLCACLLAAGLVLAAAAPGLRAKNYYFPKVSVTVAVQTDGSVLVREERTFRFSGSFHWAFYRLAKKGLAGMSGFVVADEAGPYRLTPSDTGEPGTYSISETGAAWTVRFNYSAADTDKTFVFSYRLEGAVKAYEDTADLYLKLVGTGWEKRTAEFEGRVELPREVDLERLYVFGHGPLRGRVERLGGRGAVYRLQGLGPGTFVEARVLFPSEALDMARLPGRKLDTLLAAERGLAARTEDRRRENMVLAGVLAAVPLAILLLWVYLFLNYGREYKPSQEIEYFRDIPDDLPPALVGYLMRFKRVLPADLTATIMSLIRKGYIALEPGEEEKGLIFKKSVPVVRLSVTAKKETDLAPHERLVYDMLFSEVSYEDLTGAYPGRAADFVKRFVRGRSGSLPGMAGTGSQSVSSEDIKEFIKHHPDEFRMIFETFTKLVKKEGGERNYFDPEAERWMNIFAAAVIVVPLAAVFVAVKAGLHFLIPLFIVTMFVGVFLIPPLARRTREGAESYARWKGLKRYLRDFSDLKNAPPASIAIWEYYLVYSVTFGISRKVLKQLKFVLPRYSPDDLARSNFFAASFAGGRAFDAGSFESLSGLVDTMVGSFNSITTAASTGSGGGFSGGGGGGAGGSGGGAG